VDLVLGSMAIAIVIGVSLGILTHQRPAFANGATTVTAAFLTIPSIALVGILIPILHLGLKNVLFCLVVYALLPITRNTIVGLRSVDPAIVDAGRGMGMSSRRLLWQVKIPMAWPVILAGIRVSTQMIIGIAAIGAYVNGPGLGNEIFTGLARFGSVNALNQVLIGTIGIIVVAIVFDLVYVAIGRFTTSRGIRAHS
jgi:ABC-type proline/glycine betaine transport system permease subunit